MFEHLCATLLQQAHLCPLPLEAQPIYWAHDAGLRLYPLPDALVLADPAPSAHFAFEGTVCINPVRPPRSCTPARLCSRSFGLSFATALAVHTATHLLCQLHIQRTVL